MNVYLQHIYAITHIHIYAITTSVCLLKKDTKCGHLLTYLKSGFEFHKYM